MDMTVNGAQTFHTLVTLREARRNAVTDMHQAIVRAALLCPFADVISELEMAVGYLKELEEPGE
jgi:hypothetical protein